MVRAAAIAACSTTRRNSKPNLTSMFAPEENRAPMIMQNCATRIADRPPRKKEESYEICGSKENLTRIAAQLGVHFLVSIRDVEQARVEGIGRYRGHLNGHVHERIRGSILGIRSGTFVILGCRVIFLFLFSQSKHAANPPCNRTGRPRGAFVVLLLRPLLANHAVTHQRQ